MRSIVYRLTRSAALLGLIAAPAVAGPGLLRENDSKSQETLRLRDPSRQRLEEGKCHQSTDAAYVGLVLEVNPATGEKLELIEYSVP